MGGGGGHGRARGGGAPPPGPPRRGPRRDTTGTGGRASGQLIDEVRPDTILTFGPDGRTFHPDHIAVHRWVTEEWAARGGGPRLLYAAVTAWPLDRFLALEEDLGVYMSDERPVGVPRPPTSPSTSASPVPQLDQKLTALRAMATQTSGAMAAIPAATFAEIVAEEAFVTAQARPGAGGGAGDGLERCRRRSRLMALLRRALVALGLAALDRRGAPSCAARAVRLRRTVAGASSPGPELQ